MENLKMDDLGGKPTIFGNIHPDSKSFFWESRRNQHHGMVNNFFCFGCLMMQDVNMEI